MRRISSESSYRLDSKEFEQYFLILIQKSYSNKVFGEELFSAVSKNDVLEVKRILSQSTPQIKVDCNFKDKVLYSSLE